MLDPNQLNLELFSEPAAAAMPPEPEIVEGPEGVAVSLKTRANELLFALHHMAEVRRLDGLSRASEWDSPHRPEIAERYGNYALGRIVTAGDSKAVRSERDAQGAFRRAMGTEALIDSGVEDSRQVEVDTAQAYREFWGRYFSSEGGLSPKEADRNRARFRRALSRQLERLNGAQADAWAS